MVFRLRVFDTLSIIYFEYTSMQQSPQQNPVIGLLISFVGLFVAGFMINLSVTENFASSVVIGIFVVFLYFLLVGFRVINEYERGIVLTFGKYTGLKSPGLKWIFLGVQRIIKIDMRVKAIDVPDQDCMTKDNVSVNVNAVLYYYINSAENAVLKVEDYGYAISQLAQTTMRDVVGEVTLDELLANRDELSARIQQIVDEASDEWGIKVNSVDLKHIELPMDMKRTMGKEAEAERERRAVIIKSEGEKTASGNLAEAAHVLEKSPGALHLRTLHSLNDLSSDQSNTVVFAVPLEVLRAFEKISSGK